jgi:5'-nucleotidase
VCRDALGSWTEEYVKYTQPSGQPFYWLTGKFHNEEPENPETDMYWIDRGYATVVPSRPDQSAPAAIDQINTLLGLH